MRPLEIWFELASPYSYLTVARIEPLARAAGIDLVWRPFLLGPVFTTIHGTAESPFNRNPARGKHMWTDVARRARRHGLSFHRPSVFPRGSVLATRALMLVEDTPMIEPLARRLFEASFVADRAIDTREVVTEILEEAGLDAAALLARADEPETKARLRARTDEAIRRELFGAPSFFAGEDLYWGDDRLEDALAAARE